MKLLKNPLLRIAIAPIIVLVIYLTTAISGKFDNVWWYDIPLHIMGGIAIAISAYMFLEDFISRQKFQISFKPLHILMIIAFVALTAVFWEFMEFSLDLIFKTQTQIDLLDTIKDMAMGISGGGITSVLIVLLKRK